MTTSAVAPPEPLSAAVYCTVARAVFTLARVSVIVIDPVPPPVKPVPLSVPTVAETVAVTVVPL